jgi:hypothetical protein
MAKTIRLKLLKSLPVNGEMRNANSVVDIPEGQALYFIGMGDARRANADEALSTPPPPLAVGTRVPVNADEAAQRAAIEKQARHMEQVEANRIAAAQAREAKEASKEAAKDAKEK